ncbi:hypothetical protein F2Q69_00008393 [Brassica cretica]|uniref:F-box associated beta-propeller type 1 domain-containing protein n=1 Tax=Brassica cretica TaxID=69181 RepID=A0A8S9P073_BRACR|nr:hypothetical protein F2Q69_00008393 [Brassica cretica]
MEIWVTTKIEPEEVSWNKLFFAVNMEPFLDFQFGMSQGSFFLDQEKRVVVVFDKDTDLRFTRNIYSLCHWRGWIFQTSRSRRICRISSSFWVLICSKLSPNQAMRQTKAEKEYEQYVIFQSICNTEYLCVLCSGAFTSLFFGTNLLHHNII